MRGGVGRGEERGGGVGEGKESGWARGRDERERKRVRLCIKSS